MSRQFDWGTEDRFLSNNGNGPLEARILSIANGVAKMERRNRGGGGLPVRFTLTERFLQSPHCGWRKKPKP